MNAAHLHLVLIHFPIAGAFLALPLLVLALWRHGEKGATYAAALVLTVAGGGAVAAVQTGEGAEELVEALPGIPEEALHAHEERAEAAMWASIAAGVLGLGAAGAAWSGRWGAARLVLGAALVADLAAAGAMAWTGTSGGAIRHPEIEAGATEAGAAAMPTDGRPRG